MERKIDFLIIGAQKSGTTTLYDWLAQHSDIFLPKTKEILYFAKDDFYKRGDAYLNVFYREYNGEELVGGAYVHLMYFPYTADRIHKYNPRMKCIVLLRNPVDRAYSAYWFARRNGWERMKTIEDALREEDRRKAGKYKEQAELTYLSHGLYADQLQKYLSVFGEDRIKVVLTDEFRSSTEETMDGILRFLGLASSAAELDLRLDSNRASTAIIPWVHSLILSHDTWYKRLAREIVTDYARALFRENIMVRILAMNAKAYVYPPMAPETRKAMVEYFKPHNERLEKMIGKDLRSWDR